MSQTRVLVLIAGAAISATAWAGNPDQDKAYAAELKADAQARASGLGSSNGLSLAEGDSKVVLGGFTQFRYYLNFRDDPGDGLPHQSGFTNGFEATRTRLQATGNVLSKDFTFKVEGEFTADGGSFTLLDAFARWGFDNGMGVIIGQWQNPLWREWALSPKGELGADMSVVSGVFNPGYTQGVAFNWRGDAWNVIVAADDGFRSGNTSYTSAGEADMGVTGRFEFKGGGDWKVFDDFSGWRGQDTAWLVGAGLHWQHNGDTNNFTTVQQGQIMEGAIDFQIEGNGWNGYAGVIWARQDPDSGGQAIDDFGVVLQGGIFVSDNVELFAGYNGIFPDDDYGAGLDSNFSTIMGGVNFYPFAKSSAVKFTADLQWFLDKQSETGTIAAAGVPAFTGLLPDSSDNQVALRFQLQVTF